MVRMAFWPGCTVRRSSLTVSPATLGSRKLSFTGQGDGLETATCPEDGPEDFNCTLSLSGNSARGFARFFGMGGNGRDTPGGPDAPGGPTAGLTIPGGIGRPNGEIGKSVR